MAGTTPLSCPNPIDRPSLSIAKEKGEMVIIHVSSHVQCLNMSSSEYCSYFIFPLLLSASLEQMCEGRYVHWYAVLLAVSHQLWWNYSCGIFSLTDASFVLTLFPFPSAAQGLMYPTRAIVSVIKRICWWMRCTLYELKRVMTDPLWPSKAQRKWDGRCVLFIWVEAAGEIEYMDIPVSPLKANLYVWQVWKFTQYHVTTCPAYLRKTITCLCSRIDFTCVNSKRFAEIDWNWDRVGWEICACMRSHSLQDWSVRILYKIMLVWLVQNK